MKGKSFTTKEEINDESVAFMFFIIQQIYSIKKIILNPQLIFNLQIKENTFFLSFFKLWSKWKN